MTPPLLSSRQALQHGKFAKKFKNKKRILSAKMPKANERGGGMNLLKEVLKHEVFPAMGCTEPAAIALCAANAAKLLDEKVIKAEIKTDAGTYKNGMAVTLPNANGEKGNLLAGALGILIKKPAFKMGLFKHITKDILKDAKKMISSKKIKLILNTAKKGIYIEVNLKTTHHKATCIIAGSHSNIILLKLNKKVLIKKKASKISKAQPYKILLKKKSIKDLFDIAEKLDAKDAKFIKKGIEMNLKASKEGLKIKKVGYYVQDLLKKGYLKKDVFSTARMTTSSAADARMAGNPIPIMSSGESGNQGVVAILVPHLVGKVFKVKENKILKSIALSHLVNAYIKTYTGELSPICGCAVAAGVGATVAIVYQLNGKDIKAATLAINNILSDIGGMLCDGAKSGCALKVASSSDSAIRSAYMAVNYEGITETEGFIGKTAEETIKNLAYISNKGMAKVDKVILEIMANKNIS
ncbi:MAG: L-serine ammonia-lyase, iron-sulfur-dependent, subunit alpha [Elusimicrobiota bacterium]|nr:L-serine ammonia-lyase, iron-sulfur-dependent, subunit alpha [Elusimicrobiota bacterium]